MQKPADLSLSPDPNVFTSQIEELELIQRLWVAGQQEGFKLITRLGAHDYAICLELSTKTWQSGQMLRVHAHVDEPVATHDVVERGVEKSEVHGFACSYVFGGRFSSQARNREAYVLLRHCTESGCFVFVVREKCVPGLSSQLRVDLDASAGAEDGSGCSALRNGEVH